MDENEAADDLQKLRANWERLGREDPLWAICTVPGKERGAWQLDEFLQTGVWEIEQALDLVQGLPVTPGRKRALDFGCGVGRLTRALAARFSEVHGVDISGPMIQQARELHTDIENLSFTQIEGNQLPFEERSFDFVYSRLVLQHMSTAHALANVAEFMRVLRAGGIALFQAPARRLTGGQGPQVDEVKLESGAAFIEVHAHDRAEIERVVTQAGGRILAVVEDPCAGPDFESFAYAATVDPA